MMELQAFLFLHLSHLGYTKLKEPPSMTTGVANFECLQSNLYTLNYH
jgi:hypothetical protein